jgi:hypothetical protein
VLLRGHVALVVAVVHPELEERAKLERVREEQHSLILEPHFDETCEGERTTEGEGGEQPGRAADACAIACLRDGRLSARTTLFRTTMSDALAPPARIQPLSSKPISVAKAQTQVDAFLAEYRNRGAASGGADAAVIAQLEKLSGALTE